MMFAMTPLAPSLLDTVFDEVMRAPFVRATPSDAILLKAPGVAASDLKVSVVNGTMRVAGETKTASHTHFTNWATRLPKDADADQAAATHVDGLLTVTIPRKAEAAPRRIEVNAEVMEEEQDD